MVVGLPPTGPPNQYRVVPGGVPPETLPTTPPLNPDSRPITVAVPERMDPPLSYSLRMMNLSEHQLCDMDGIPSNLFLYWSGDQH